MRRRAAVTGATGFVGRFIVAGLIDEGWKVTVLGRSEPPAGMFAAPVSFIPYALGGLAGDALAGQDVLVHAAFDHVPGRYRGGEGDDPAGFRARNLVGSVDLFRAARQAGVARAVFLSSRAVYGTQAPGEALHEDTLCLPDTLYGEVKLAAEQALAELAGDDFHTASLRVTGVYGQPAPGAPHKWEALIADWRAGRVLPPRVAGEVHGVDVAQAVSVALHALGAGANRLTLNVSDIAVDHADIVRVLNDLEEGRVEPPPRSDASVLNLMDTAWLRALGWRPGGLPLLRQTLAGMLAGQGAIGTSRHGSSGQARG